MKFISPTAKWIALCFLVIAMFVEVNPVLAAVALEEVELSIMEGDHIKEIKSLRQREASETARKLRQKGQKVISKKLERPRLRFFDKQGKITKEIILGTETVEVSGSYGGTSEVLKRKKVSIRRADLSPGENWAAIWDTHSEPFDPGDARQSGAIVTLDEGGNTIWQKVLPRFKAVGACRISNTGMTIAVQSWTKAHQLPASEPIDQLVVYDGRGNELFQFPKSRSEGFDRLHAGTNDLIISPNGRYVGVRASKGKNEIVLFLDLTKKSNWAMPVAGAPIDISDDGVARVARLAGVEVEIVQLKERL